MASFFTRNCCIRAKNCQPVSVVTKDEMQITAAMARKYDEENTTRMLANRLRGLFPADVMSCAPPTATSPLRQIKTISTVLNKRKSDIPRCRRYLPKVLTTVLDN